MQSYDERRDVAVPGKRPVALAFCVQHFVTCANHAIDERGTFHVALAGGSTPKSVYQILSMPPYSNQIDWSKVHLYWGDERCVEPTSDESNFKMSMEAGLKNLPIPENQIHRMEGEKDPDESAEAYCKLLPKHMDLILLGMGEDGHTASLFPNTKALDEEERPCIANYVPEKDSWRITLTFPYLDKARGCVFYVFGKSKKSMVRKVLRGEEKYPAGRVGHRGCKALWICDQDACPLG